MEIDGTDDDSKEVDEWRWFWGDQKYTLEKWDGTLPDGQICQHSGSGKVTSPCSAKAEVALVRPAIAGYGDLTVAQLKQLCEEGGLPVSGKKAELVARLWDAMGNTDHHAPAVKNALAAFKKGDFAVAAEKLEFVLEVWENSEGWAEENIVTRYTYFCEEHAVWEREYRRLFQLYEDYADELFGTIEDDLGLQPAGCLQCHEATEIMAGTLTVEEAVLGSALSTARFELEEILRDYREPEGDWDPDLEGTAAILRILEELDIPSTSLTKWALSDDF